MGLSLGHVFISGGIFSASCTHCVWGLNVFLFCSSLFHKIGFQEHFFKNSSWVEVWSCCFQITCCAFTWMPLFILGFSCSQVFHIPCGFYFFAYTRWYQEDLIAIYILEWGHLVNYFCLCLWVFGFAILVTLSKFKWCSLELNLKGSSSCRLRRRQEGRRRINYIKFFCFNEVFAFLDHKLYLTQANMLRLL